MTKPSNIKIYLFYLIAISTLIRCLIASVIELGGEEAYYWTFALYPKLSHLDHPPMIGWFIQLFTNNLLFNSEFITRSASIFIGSINIWIVFILGRRMKNELAGLYAAILYVTSIYCSIITGTLITPEAPQSMFILLSLYFLHEAFITKYEDSDESRTLSSISIVMAGVFIGLAMLSKFSSVLIWVGALSYITFFDRRFLKKPQLYISILISLLVLSPVIIWNIKNNFIGFRYIDTIIFAISDNITFNYIVRALFRTIIYNNPVNIILAIIAIYSYKHHRFLASSQYKLMLSISLPFFIFGLFSIGFFPLIMLSGIYLEFRYHFARLNLPRILKNSILVMILIVFTGITQLYTGFIDFEIKKSPTVKLGTIDFTLDSYGWKTLSKEFKELRNHDVALGNISEHAFIISNNYSSAAHYEYYLAKPLNISVKTIGKINKTRKYAYTTEQSGGFKIGESAYYIESSRDPVSGESIGRSYYDTYDIAKILYIRRMNKPVLRYIIYRFKDMKELPPKELTSVPVIF